MTCREKPGKWFQTLCVGRHAGRKSCRAIFERAALRRDHLARKNVPGRVCGDIVANPIVVGPNSGRFQLFGAHEQEVGPFVSPVVNEFGPAEKGFDQRVALRGGFVCQEIASLLTSGENAACVNESAPDEFRIGAAG